MTERPSNLASRGAGGPLPAWVPAMKEEAMKLMIGVDCEGPACVVGAPSGALGKSRNLEFAKLQATREADAAACGSYLNAAFASSTFS